MPTLTAQLQGKAQTDMGQNVAGVVGSLASRAIFITLLSVFTQCRAFNEPSRQKSEMMNMVSLTSPVESAADDVQVVVCTVRISRSGRGC